MNSRYESGPIYKPNAKDFELVLHEVSEADAARLRSIWAYWEDSATIEEEGAGTETAEDFHPDLQR